MGIIKVLNKVSENGIKIINATTPIIGEYIHLKLHKEDHDIGFYNNIRILGEAIDTRDYITAGHSKRVADYSILIAKLIDLPAERIEILKLAAELHDIGKIGLPESVLYKPGKLSEDEYRLVKEHPKMGYDLVSKIQMERKFRRIPEIILCHHEKVDGSGYPDGRTGKDIPLESRIISVCDVFDALTNVRTYRTKLSFDKAKKILELERNSLDSNMIDVFFDIPDSTLMEIYSQYEI